MFEKLFKKKKNTINYLEQIPICKHEHSKNDKGLVDVLVPRFKNPTFKKVLTPKNKEPYIRANLDEFGSETWLNIDGIKTVEAIGIALVEKFGDSIQPVYDRLTLFLTQLYNNGFITFKSINERK